MKHIQYLLLGMSILAGGPAAGICTQKKAAVMNDDIYVDVKAHEVAIIETALRGTPDAATGSETQIKEYERLAQKSQDDIKKIRKKLLTSYGISEKDYAAYEAQLLSAGLNQLTGMLKGVRLDDIKKISSDPQVMRALRIAGGIAGRSEELKSEQVNK